MPAFVLALLLNAGAAGQAGLLTGTVVDSSGAPIPNATVRLDVSGATMAEADTGSDGRFALKASVPGGARIVVTAAGFAQAVEAVSDNDASLRITLQVAPFFEAVNVTSSRTGVPRADPTETVTVFSSAELLTSAPPRSTMR